MFLSLSSIIIIFIFYSFSFPSIGPSEKEISEMIKPNIVAINTALIGREASKIDLIISNKRCKPLEEKKDHVTCSFEINYKKNTAYYALIDADQELTNNRNALSILAFGQKATDQMNAADGNQNQTSPVGPFHEKHQFLKENGKWYAQD